MQTFLPHPNFEDSVKTLDMKRLGKQRVETYQIMIALLENRGWINHPATRMWRGYEWALLLYQHATVDEWLARGYPDTCLEKTLDVYERMFDPNLEIFEMPPWFGEPAFHLSHQSNLIRKNPEHYGPLFPGVPTHLPYIWPETKFSRRSYMASYADNLTFEDAQLMFRNFAGEEKPFNPKGQRNFLLMLNPEQAEECRRLGLNVNEMRPIDEDSPPRPNIKVKVNFNSPRPPKIVLVTHKGKMDMDESTAQVLDYADIEKADITINLWEHGMETGKSTHSAFLSTGYFFIKLDPLTEKYADLPDANPTTTDLSLIVNDVEEVPA